MGWSINAYTFTKNVNFDHDGACMGAKTETGIAPQKDSQLCKKTPKEKQWSLASHTHWVTIEVTPQIVQNLNLEINMNLLLDRKPLGILKKQTNKQPHKRSYIQTKNISFFPSSGILLKWFSCYSICNFLYICCWRWSYSSSVSHVAISRHWVTFYVRKHHLRKINVNLKNAKMCLQEKHCK